MWRFFAWKRKFLLQSENPIKKFHFKAKIVLPIAVFSVYLRFNMLFSLIFIYSTSNVLNFCFRSGFKFCWQTSTTPQTVPNIINFPRYNRKCNGEDKILRGLFQDISCFHLHFVLYRGNFDHFLDSALSKYIYQNLLTFQFCITCSKWDGKKYPNFEAQQM